VKLIVAIINPQRLGYVTAALRRAKIPGATVTNAKGFGKEMAEIDWDLSGELTEKIRIEVVIEDQYAEQIARIIQRAASTGHAGDGIIYMQEVFSSIRLSFGDSTGMHKLTEEEKKKKSDH
jgi:nitrogen regulatory protein P-II 1